MDKVYNKNMVIKLIPNHMRLKLVKCWFNVTCQIKLFQMALPEGVLNFYQAAGQTQRYEKNGYYTVGFPFVCTSIDVFCSCLFAISKA